MKSVQRINNGKGHWYKVDGRKADGVTTLISKGLPKPALPYWSARMVAEYVADAEPHALDGLRSLGRNNMITTLKNLPWSQRDKAAARGTAVHAIADKLVRGQTVDYPIELAGHVESAVKFLDSWRVAPLLCETTVASRQWLYAGTLDLVADLPDGRRALIDYKTSRSGVWPETALQLAAYRHADFYLGDDDTEMPMSEVGIDCAYAVWLRADGYDVHPVRCDKEVFQAFLHVAQVARLTEQMGDWIDPAELWEPAA